MNRTERASVHDANSVVLTETPDKRPMSPWASSAPEDVRWWKHPTLRNALAAAAFSVAGFSLAHLGLIPSRLEDAAYLVAVPLGAWHWAREALEKLVEEHAVGIGLLMLAATIGSCLLGLFDEAAFLVVLYGAAEALEDFAYDRARHAIRALLKLAPKQARILRDGGETTVPAETLKPGDRFRVRPGEAVPTDGVIVAGRTSLDESAVTGESIPVDKGPGMRVFAATLNRQGSIDVEATAAFADNTLAKIIALVEKAQARKASAQQWIERFGRWYSPTVLIIAAAVVIAGVLTGGSAPFFNKAVVLLVAAAPCALVMSMPVAMAAAIGRGGRRGILIKGGLHLEHLAAIRVVALDKTGTLTRGRPEVSEVYAVDGDEARLVSLAAGIETFSEHPLARAIVDHALARGLKLTPVSDFESLAGAGAKATWMNEEWLIGSQALFKSLGVNLDAIGDRAREFEEAGGTGVLLGTRTRVIGAFSLADRLRDEAPDVIRALHGMGLRVVMLTGDSERAARAVANAVDIEEIHAGLRPEDKVRMVRELAELDHAVMMVGDGVNDAPALAEATCGVAMGAAGSDAAIEAADVALMADDIARLPDAMALARRAMSISRQNIAFSLFILAILIPAALLGFLSVAQAVVVHEGSELLAVANGLRAGR